MGTVCGANNETEQASNVAINGYLAEHEDKNKGVISILVSGMDDVGKTTFLQQVEQCDETDKLKNQKTEMDDILLEQTLLLVDFIENSGKNGLNITNRHTKRSVTNIKQHRTQLRSNSLEDLIIFWGDKTVKAALTIIESNDISSDSNLLHNNINTQFLSHFYNDITRFYQTSYEPIDEDLIALNQCKNVHNGMDTIVNLVGSASNDGLIELKENDIKNDDGSIITGIIEVINECSILFDQRCIKFYCYNGSVRRNQKTFRTSKVFSMFSHVKCLIWITSLEFIDQGVLY